MDKAAKDDRRSTASTVERFSSKWLDEHGYLAK